jgi:hypothetical protein
MADLWGVQVTLTNGQTRLLANSIGDTGQAVAHLRDFEAARGQFAGKWLQTQDSSAVARAHIVEVRVSQLR